MFNGIIFHKGKIKKISKRQKGLNIFISSKLNVSSKDIGMSISCDGVCLTLENIRNRVMEFYLSKETISRSKFKNSKINDLVNIENKNDLVNYFKHWIAHKVPFLWDFHEFHHSATQMTILSNWRKDHLAGLFTSPLVVPITALMGLLLNEYLSSGYILPVIIFLIVIS